ncbi:MAG: TlpA family protein disulfide reductase, partial [Porticoccaceae bacterium]|nr:TlpA family protein disulfide reductase [Porticoccaceae bacterium]
EKMADIEAPTLQGSPQRLSDYRGKVLLLDLWATWCSPCKQAIPALREMKEELQGRPFQLISISVDDDPETVLEYIETEQAMPWVHWHVGPEHEQIDGIVGYPTYFVIDENGVLQAKLVGSGSEHRIRKELIRLVEIAERDGS